MLRDDVLEVIESHALNRPRTLQKAPGVSDIAGTCDHCVAARLAGWVKAREVAWLAEVGTAVHQYLGPGFTGPEWLVEHGTDVARVGEWMVHGTADLIHLPSRTVVDLKTKGKARLDAARRGNVPEEYINQVNVYAWALKAERVALCFLPRNSPNLRDMVWWEEPACAATAERVIERARRLAAGVAAAGTEFIAGLDRDPACWDCARYPDAPVVLVEPGSVLDSMMKGR